MLPNSIFVPKWLGGVIARLEKTADGARIVSWNSVARRWEPVPEESIDAAMVFEAPAASAERLAELGVLDPVTPRISAVA